MRNFLTTFDTYTAKVIGNIPETLVSSFIWLGRITTPLGWGLLISVLSLAFITPGVLTHTELLVLVLLPVATFIKYFVRRDRPPTIYSASMKIKSYSFPSSHAYAATLVTCYMIRVLQLSNSIILTALLIGFALTIIVSRVRIGAHYPSDVIAGACLALLVSQAFFR